MALSGRDVEFTLAVLTQSMSGQWIQFRRGGDTAARCKFRVPTLVEKANRVLTNQGIRQL